MSGQVKLTLRPPPNVDFVHGYPGIPPGAVDRPQAAVKGAIEVRAGPQGIKAKWVRVELRKVETLPGGGPQDTFYDFVGPSPVTLWTASDEYGILRSQDFPFQIRIPESIPPSIALENRAGIRYELLASVCTKGKRSFLRRRKSSVVSTQANIIIDKHELHSTWPVYCQPETRQITHEGVTLTVERSSTCYGPGDKISVMATLKSESMHTVLLRGFELTLKESTIFRAGPYTSGKKNVPQVRVAIVGESRLPVNFSLYGGMVQKAELTCSVSPNHTTTTLNTARHIDITYMLSVKALLDTAHPLVMDLPVILSNWQRVVSSEAIRRIGPAPALSLLPSTAAHTPPVPVNAAPSMRVEPAPSATRARPSEAQTFGGLSSKTEFTRPSTANTVNGNDYSSNTNGQADELGYGASHTKIGQSNGPKVAARHTDEFGSLVNQAASSTGTSLRPSDAATGNASSRFTVTNVAQDSQHRRGPSGSGSIKDSPRQWLTAEDEKRRLYERAKAQAEITQTNALRGASPPPVATRASPPQAKSPTRSGTWLSAEEEKTRLYNQAQAAAMKHQGLDTYVSPQPQSIKPNIASMSSYQSSRSGSVSSAVPQYPSAEEEKAALRRYEEAKRAVERTQNAGFEVDGGSSSSTFNPPPANDMPPSFEASTVPVLDARTQLAEKERLRRAYEAQDAVAIASQNNAANDVPAYSSSPPPFLEGNSIQNAIAEKEMMRRKFELQDAQAMASGTSSPSPPRQASPSPQRPRPTPAPPAAGGSRVMTAVEEKALLRARYENEDLGMTSRPPPPPINGYTNGYTNGTHADSSPSPSSSFTQPPAPPPLMPRPPAEYIQETQEEDARVSRYVGQTIQLEDDVPPLPTSNMSLSVSALDMRPFTPFSSAFDTKGNIINSKVIGVPPLPLPPKPPGSD